MKEILARLIKMGLNKKDAERKASEFLPYVNRVYPDASIKEKCNIIASLHE
jgi:hypothetical protein